MTDENTSNESNEQEASDSDNYPHARVKVLVDPQLQLRLMIPFFLLILCLLGMALVFFSTNAKDLYSIFALKCNIPQAALDTFTQNWTSNFWLHFVFYFLGLILLTFFSSLYISYKIAGATVGLKRGIKAILNNPEGNPISLRKDDLLHDLVELIKTKPKSDESPKD